MILLACNHDPKNTDPDEIFNYADSGYFYYSSNWQKNLLYLRISELTVKFPDDSLLSEGDAIDFLNKYLSSVDSFTITSWAEHNSYRLNFPNDDTLFLMETLAKLNQDSVVEYAFPVFTNSPELKLSICGDNRRIFSSRILCAPMVTEDEFLQLITKFDVQIVHNHGDGQYYVLSIDNIITGFEPMIIANSLYATRKFSYSYPDFYATLCLD